MEYDEAGYWDATIEVRMNDSLDWQAAPTYNALSDTVRDEYGHHLRSTLIRRQQEVESSCCYRHERVPCTHKCWLIVVIGVLVVSTVVGALILAYYIYIDQM